MTRGLIPKGVLIGSAFQINRHLRILHRNTLVIDKLDYDFLRGLRT